MEHILIFTYSAGGAAAAAFHIPQFLRLWRTPGTVCSISILSWAGWFTISLNGLAYALVINRDPAFIGMACLNLLCQGIMLGLIARARLLIRPAKAAVEMEIVQIPANANVEVLAAAS